MAIPAGGGTHAVKQGIGTLFGENSYLTYALQKSADMVKYGMYQAGWFGEELKAKYDGEATFDLAGGVDFTIWEREGLDAAGKTTRYGGVGVQITSKGMRVHNGAGEFGGLAFVMGTNGQVVWQGVETWESTMDGVILAGWKFTEWVVNAMSVFETAIEDSGR
ncbi:MAG: hypothetical protein HPY78_10315, partial [Brevinematales bacterium]|nr:hypothetical protein [Brevinematales bacterium]